MDEPVRPDPAPSPAEPAQPVAEASSAPPQTAVVVAQAGHHFGRVSPRATLVIAAAGVLAVVLYLGSAALGPFVVGLVLAYLLDMPVERMSRVGFPRWLASAVVPVSSPRSSATSSSRSGCST